jgi:ligand-binding SRPBCC domain-containing protein
MSKLYSLTRIQKFPVPADTLWNFITSPANLKKITPEKMGFVITSDTPVDKTYPGLIISYKISPIWNIPLNWVTEITHVESKKYFADEQRFGPYQLWHHKHFLKEIDGGTEMTDIVHYKIPFGFLGDLANTILVKKQLADIFDYRFQKLEEIFGKYIR